MLKKKQKMNNSFSRELKHKPYKYTHWVLTGLCLILLFFGFALIFDFSKYDTDYNNYNSEEKCLTFGTKRDDTFGSANHPQGRYLKAPHTLPVGIEDDELALLDCASTSDKRNLSSWIWAFAEFISHDIFLTEGCVKDKNNTCHPLNAVTSFIDASMIYSNALRSFEDGKLRVSHVQYIEGELLPLDDENVLFVSGDLRANENLVILSLYTLWTREHNYWARKIKSESKTELKDQIIFDQAQRIVISELNSIAYNEFLPALLGIVKSKLPCFDKSIDPRAYLEFSTMAFQLIQTMGPNEIYIVDPKTKERVEDIAIENVIFNAPVPASNTFIWKHDIDSLILGLSEQRSEQVDPCVHSRYRGIAISNMLDSSVAEYEPLRIHFETRHSELSHLCDHLDEIKSAWIGSVCEKPEDGSSVGHTLSRIIRDQFERIRLGDPTFHEKFHQQRLLTL